MPGTRLCVYTFLHVVVVSISKSNHFFCNLQTVKAMGEVIRFYDSDNQYPAWGFGGNADDQPVSHCFSLNGRTDNANVRRAYIHMCMHAFRIQTTSTRSDREEEGEVE